MVKPELDPVEMLTALNNREAKMNTSVAPGIAVPHGYFRGLDGIIGAVGFSRQGIEYGSHDNKLVHLVFMILLGDGAQEQHLHILSRILTLERIQGLIPGYRSKSSCFSGGSWLF
ncbi:PTS sugar transporter subunit IIA [Treponema sp. TIM-1]|uniref:PTS sugar transporter subunit IIA n=1 Tax=Treponema sp. TIM-1 TaxID=2898417 RepID=UPI00398033E7